MPATTCFRLPLFLVVLFMRIDQTSSMNAKGVNFSFKGLGSVEAVYGVLSRVLKRDAKLLFDLKFTDRCGEKHRDQESGRSELCFEILNGTAPVSGDATEANLHHRIRIRATSGPDLAYGCAHYLRQRAHLSFSWNRTGGNIIGSSLLADWPPHVPEDLEVRYRRVDISYFMNVVTFSYTFAFYGFREWEALLDWAALSGINLGLAYTGQEEVYRKTFSKFGVNDTAFLPWVNGPAYLAWSRGQSIHGVAESPPISWLQDQWRLQKRILGRMREIGIVAVLPAFQGNVPPVMKELFPRANISVRSDGLAAWIDALDPLFSEIGNAFLRNLINDFGTDHWYEADGYFNTQESPWLLQHSSKKNADHDREHHHPRAKQGGGAKAPWQSPDDVPIDQNAYLRARSAYAPMKNVDPDAIWLYQGWVWRGFSYEQLPFIKGFVEAVPKGNFVVLDMYDEEMEQWELFNDFSYFDAPFIWSVLHNFGGNTGMWGSIPLLNSRPFRAFENRNNSVAGTGFAPEGFDQNPPYYTFITDVNWMEEPCTDLQQWWKNYAAQRYGLIDDDGGDKGGGDDDDVIRGSTSRGHSASSSPALPLLQRAWIILGNSVYGKDQPSVQEQGFMCEKAREGLTVLPLGGGEDQPQHEWYELSKALSAWKMLVKGSLSIISNQEQHRRGKSRRKSGSSSSNDLHSSSASSTSSSSSSSPPRSVFPSTLNYDIVNVGREVLAKVSTRMFFHMTNATTPSAVNSTGQKLLDIQRDADELLCSDPGFRVAEWISQATSMADVLIEEGRGRESSSSSSRIDDIRRYFELNARSQPTTWEPQQKGSTQLTGIVDYANKHWGGLVGSFYRGRTKCYIDQYMEDFCGGDDDSCSPMDIAGEGTSASFNKTSYIKRVAEWSYQWTHDFGARRYPLCAYDEVKHVAALSSVSSSTATTRKLDREGSTNYGIIGGQRIDNDDDTGDNDNTALAVPAAVSISRRLISKYSACVEDPQQC
mmetsp:Transcript_3055/g.4692  ORF Transcript_3055/g.4692 Transcript_3055/m.4692 type:complete len:989 (-) Transcript_3055:215-3181(-)